MVLALITVAVRADDKPLRQSIDVEIKAGWEKHKLTPAGRADDATFLRRIYLDLAGTIPTAEEARKFLADADPKKREKLIDALLADPRFAEHQADVWDLVLFGRRPGNQELTAKRPTFKKWLSEQFAKNQPHDRWVRDLLLAEQEGTELFYAQYRNNPEETTVAVSRVFLGTQLQCARCHDHPFESWSQKDFYGMAGFFVRLVVQESGSGMQKKVKIAEKASGEVLFSGAAKDQKPGKKGEPIQPRFLNGTALVEPPLPKDFKEVDARTGAPLPKPPFSRKEKLAEWLTASANPYFARAAVNRVWAQYMGRGFIHPVDDLSEKNEASHPALFAAMTKQFVDHKLDLKYLIREIVNSEAYQQAATGAETDAMPRYYDRARIRPLSAEELWSTIRVATGTTETKPGGNTGEYFNRYFGEPTNGQGDFQGSLAEHLFLNNSSEIRQMIQRRKGNLLDITAASTDPMEKRVETMFLSVLTRLPTAKEKDRFVAYLKSGGMKPEAVMEEAVWVLLNCSEFRFNH